ncbi:MAG: domain S-box protein [Candidatus Hydrogenedentes bacterium]|nr:domain S-box protein [Candidatus Hydrogenedentota bacterium]
MSWVVGIARIAVLAISAIGIYRYQVLFGYTVGHRPLSPAWLSYFLMGLYAFNLISGILYLSVLKRYRVAKTFMTWTQVLLDFGVIAATVGFTGGTGSFFTFLLVIVILEAGLLLGFTQGFVFAILASIFVLVQFWLADSRITNVGYNILVQTLSFMFTAFISGYWNHRIYRLQEFQHDILDNMNSGFLITDRNGIIWAQNRAADRILELASGEAIGRPVEKVIRPDSGGECPIVTALRAQRDFSSYEFYAQIPSERRRLLGLTTSRLYDERGRLNGIIASFTDLTEIDTMRQEMRQQDRLAAVGELSAGVAHEIRNPVAIIRSAVEELSHNLADERIAQRLAAMALRESDHLNEIVSGFLDFARNPVARRETFDLRGLVHETEQRLRQKYIDSTELTIAAGCPDTPCNIDGDSSKIEQVFMNLGVNAVEAMQNKGHLAIGLVSETGSYEVRFDDDGPGLDPGEIARIFDPFYTTKPSGVGMGLAVCLRIVTAHDGTIRAGSREGGGTRMTVRLPAAREG